MFIEMVLRNGKTALVNLSKVCTIKEQVDDYGVKCVVFTFEDTSNQVWAPGCLEELKTAIGLQVKAKVEAKAKAPVAAVKPLKGKASKQA